MPATVDAPRIARQPRDSGAETTSRNDATTTDKTLAQWEKFLAKQPGCDSGFTAAPRQAMRAINVSSAAQVPMILRELHRGDESIRISFPPSADPKVTEDQIKIRAFLQEHHGKELASLKNELTTLLEGSHSFKELQANNKFSKAFDSAAKWIDANFTGVESNNSMLTVTDVVSLEGATEKREETIAAAIVSLEESDKSGRAAVVTVSHADAQDPALKDAIRARLDEAKQIDPSNVKVWIGAEVGAITKERTACLDVKELSLGEFLASTDYPVEANKEAVGSASAPDTEPADQAPGDSLGALQIGAAASKAFQEASLADNQEQTTAEAPCAPTQATELKVGVAVDNHREGYQQEDRHFVAPFPPMEPEQAMEYLRHGVTAMDEVTKHNTSGSTFTGVIVTKDGDFVTAHLGDSPASAIIIGSNGTLKRVVPLTVDHKPGKCTGTSPSGLEFEDLDGYRRVEGAGGIAMTRALGDARFGDTLSHEPEIKLHQIQSQLEAGDRLFLLTTSDGAHNERKAVTHSHHAETIAKELGENAPLQSISEQIATNSAMITDNVTVTLLEVEKGRGAIVAVFDGHDGSETSARAQQVLLDITERFNQMEQAAPREREARLSELRDRLDIVRNRLSDAWKLEGEFSSHLQVHEEAIEIERKLTAVKKIRELDTHFQSATDDKTRASFRAQMVSIYKQFEMGQFEVEKTSFSEDVDKFELLWTAKQDDIQETLIRLDRFELQPEIAAMTTEIAGIEIQIAYSEGQITSTRQAEMLESSPTANYELTTLINTIKGAKEAIGAADRVIELSKGLRQRVLPEADKTKLRAELLEIYNSREMFTYRQGVVEGRREPLTKAVMRFRSHWETQLRDAEDARTRYIPTDA